MSRGGRGGSRGAKRGPDLSWDDEETTTEQPPDMRRPRPLFPQRYIAMPKPLSTSETASEKSFMSFSGRIGKGPLYAVLDPTIFAPSNSTTRVDNGGSQLRRVQQAVTKPNTRAGFNPFTDQEKYTLRYHPKRRTYPDLSERECYTLKLFPLELWSVLDPKRKMPEWDGLTEKQKSKISGSTSVSGRGAKQKRAQALRFDDDDGDGARRPIRDGSDDSGAEDEDVRTGRRKRKDKEKKKEGTGKQKKGLDAEDDYPEVDQQDEDAEGDGAADDEPQDSEFGTDEEDEEDGGDDYNAEQYFDDGADDFGDGDGGDDDGGGVF